MSVTMPERELTPCIYGVMNNVHHANLHVQQCTNAAGPLQSFYEQTSSVCSSASTAIRLLQLTIYIKIGR